MSPYTFVHEAVANGESLLSLCSGIGLELSGLQNPDITAVDLHQAYLDEIRHRCDQAKTVCSDALTYIKAQPDSSVDVISVIDGLEHMEKKTGKQLIKHMKRVAKKQIVLFVPQGKTEDGYLRNEPHNAWGVAGGDDYQTHKSGWTLEELQALGFELLHAHGDISQHGEPYTALMMSYHV